MMRVLTSDVMVRFMGGFAIGCMLVVIGVQDVLNAAL